MVDFSRLEKNWAVWTKAARMGNVAASVAEDRSQCEFASDDQQFRLRDDGGRWVVDRVDDRGQRHDGVAKFSTFELAEKYLIWRWSSTARSAIGAASLGAKLHSRGTALGVTVEPTALAGALNLRSAAGSATVPRSIAQVFSHLMEMDISEVERMVAEGLTG